jgi:hypothetical protein
MVIMLVRELCYRALYKVRNQSKHFLEGCSQTRGQDSSTLIEYHHAAKGIILVSYLTYNAKLRPLSRFQKRFTGSRI